jgi:hypothetical protein
MVCLAFPCGNNTMMESCRVLGIAELRSRRSSGGGIGEISEATPYTRQEKAILEMRCYGEDVKFIRFSINIQTYPMVPEWAWTNHQRVVHCIIAT